MIILTDVITEDLGDEMILHNIPPVWDENSKILILGSFPSVKSRSTQFFYGHAQNRFWRLLSSLLGEGVPGSIEDKKKLLLKYHIALWDVVKSCDIVGSSDSTIKNVTPNDLSQIINGSRVRKIFTNGQTAYKLYNKYIFPITSIEAHPLPSTSPANAAYNMERLIDEWKIIGNYL